MHVSARVRWIIALLMGTTALVWLVGNTYPDRVFSVYLEVHRWIAAAGPMEELAIPRSIPSNPTPLSKEESAKQFVLLPAKAARWVAKSGTWQPAKKDIEGLEVSLQQVSSLRAENWPANARIAIDHPEQYYRQYIPVIRKGRKLVYVNAFCDVGADSKASYGIFRDRTGVSSLFR